MRFANVTAAIAKGMLAGAVGTLAMAGTRKLEERTTGRERDTAAAAAAAKVFGVQPVGPKERERFGDYVHWTYGTAWGGALGVLHLLSNPRVPSPAIIATYGTTVFAVKLWLLPWAKVTPPLREWRTGEVVWDVGNHAVYAATTGVTYMLLSRLLDRD